MSISLLNYAKCIVDDIRPFAGGGKFSDEISKFLQSSFRKKLHGRGFLSTVVTIALGKICGGFLSTVVTVETVREPFVDE